MSKKGSVKNNKSSKIKTNTNYDTEITNIVKFLLIVIVIFAVVYFVVALIRGDIRFGKDKEEQPEVTIQYEEILGGEILNIAKSEYFVLLYDYTSNEANLFSTLLSKYKAKSGALSVYKVNLANPLNQRYVTNGDSTKYPVMASDLLVNDATLLQVKDGKVILYLEGKDAIKEHILNISK